MDLTRLTRDADDLIRKVVSRYNQLYVPSGAISQVELDLLLDDLRNLYDTFKTIEQENLNRQHPQERPQVSVASHINQEPAYTQPEQVSDAGKPATYDYSATKPTTEAESKPMYAPEPIPEQIAEAESQSVPTEGETEWTEQQPALKQESFTPQPEITETPKPAYGQTAQTTAHEGATPLQQAAASTLAEKFNTPKSLSEVIASSQPSAGTGARMLLQPIADLNTGIGLNDKFSFISELFGNNPAIYEEAITRINRAVNLDEANWILQKYHSHEWDHKHETHNRLKNFIKRRFI